MVSGLAVQLGLAAIIPEVLGYPFLGKSMNDKKTVFGTDCQRRAKI
jgi:hypothetical protein